MPKKSMGARSPWTTERVKAVRMRTNAQKDLRNFSGKGRYTPQPGRGPYAWKDTSQQPAPFDGGETSLRGTEPEGWHRAPNDSHVEAFRFLGALDDATDLAVLQVRFKVTPNGKGGGEYEYYGNNPSFNKRLEFIYDLMVSAESPGELVWSHLIKPEVPYRETIGRA